MAGSFSYCECNVICATSDKARLLRNRNFAILIFPEMVYIPCMWECDSSKSSMSRADFEICWNRDVEAIIPSIYKLRCSRAAY